MSLLLDEIKVSEDSSEESSFEDITLNPIPAFAIKTAVVAATKSPKRDQGTKAFINVCTDIQVPEPDGGYGEELIVRVSNGEDWIVPIVPSQERIDTDKAGRTCIVWDCCMHPRVVMEASRDPAIKILLTETCIELIESTYSVDLSREYVFPKLTAKGQLEKTVLKSSDVRPGSKNSVTNSVEGLVKEVMKVRSDPGEGSGEGSGTFSKPLGSTKALIQEIGHDTESMQLDNSSEEPASKEPDIRYKYILVENSKQSTLPSYDIQISGISEQVASSQTIEVLSNDKLQFAGLQIPIKRSSSIEAVYTKDTQILHVFLYA